MEYVVFTAVLLLAFFSVLYAMIGKSRYQDMTEEEFEAEARRGSPVGNALLGAQSILEPGRKVEYVLQQDKRSQGDSAESADSPPDHLTEPK